jgi:hypothetical protein
VRAAREELHAESAPTPPATAPATPEAQS